MNETRIPQATPEQLIKLLDTELNMTRSKRTGVSGHRRAALLAGGLLFIIAACCAALLILQQMLSDLQQRAASKAPQASEQAGESKNL